MMRTLTVALLVLLFAATAQPEYLKNGNFDDAGPPLYETSFTTEIPNWTVTSDESLLLTDPQSAQAGVFYVFGDVSADTDEMVLITNWPNREDFEPRFFDTDFTKLTSDPFLVTGDHGRIEFDYVYVTQEPGTADRESDPFEVSLIRASDESILATWFIVDAFDPSLGFGGISGYPFQGATTRQSSDWTHYKIDILPWSGETVRLVFTISDTGDDILNSGVLLENVAQTPEPATFVAFGLGALGLGYLVRRRRRMKK
jgi:hypothetical protein